MGNGCPFSRITRHIKIAGKDAQNFLVIPEGTGHTLQEKEYQALASEIDIIFGKDFFVQDIDLSVFYGIFPIQAHSIFGKLGQKNIQKFFQNNPTYKRTSIASKIGGTNIQVIEDGWGHACRVFGLILNKIYRNVSVSDEELEYMLKEAKKMYIQLAYQPLEIETAIMMDIDTLMQTGSVSTEKILSGCQYDPRKLPRIGCPAIFMGEKTAHALFEMMNISYMGAYRGKSNSKILGEKIRTRLGSFFPIIAPSHLKLCSPSSQLPSVTSKI